MKIEHIDRDELPPGIATVSTSGLIRLIRLAVGRTGITERVWELVGAVEWHIPRTNRAAWESLKAWLRETEEC